MHKRIILIFFALVFSQQGLAKATATVDTNSINVEESFTLTISVDDIIDDLSPELSPLHRDFTIYDTRKNSQRSIINGSYSSTTQWFITLIPKRSGKLMIPPISVNNDVTSVIAMSVSKTSESPLGEKKQQLFIEANTDVSESYIGAQIIYTLKLYHSVNLSNGSTLSEPEPDKAQTKKLSENSYQSIVNGMAYNIVERKYAIYPTATGTLEIPSVLLNAVITDGRSTSLFGSPRGQSRRVIRRTAAISIKVNELPIEAKNKDAIAAKSLKLHQKWSSNINNIKVGDSVTRNILIIAEGAYAAQLPPLLMKSQDGLKLYSDQPQINDKDSETGIVGQRQESIAIVPTKAGDYTLPEVSAYWFDTKTETLKKASLAALSFTVKPSDNSVATLESMQAPSTITSNIIKTEKNALIPYAKTNIFGWQLATLISSTLWLLTLIYILFIRKKNTLDKQQVNQVHMEKIISEKEIFKKLTIACKEHDTINSIDFCLQWARLYWNKPTINTIAAIDEQANSQVALLLRQLEANIYGTKITDKNIFQQLAKLITTIRNDKRQDVADLTVAPLYSNNKK